MPRPPDSPAALPARKALRAREEALAVSALERAWALTDAGDARRPVIALSLAQAHLGGGDSARAGRVLAEGRAEDAEGAWAVDFDLLAALAAEDDAPPEVAATAIHAALARAVTAGPPAQGRVLDRMVRLAHLRRVAPPVLLQLMAEAEHDRRDAAGTVRGRWDTWLVVLDFVVAWSHDPDDPSLGTLARHADDATGDQWGFVAWEAPVGA